MQRWGPQCADRAGKPVCVGVTAHIPVPVLYIGWDSDKSFNTLQSPQEVVSLTQPVSRSYRHTGHSVTWECSKG